jgi:hypothetical protein
VQGALKIAEDSLEGLEVEFRGVGLAEPMMLSAVEIYGREQTTAYWRLPRRLG